MLLDNRQKILALKLFEGISKIRSPRSKRDHALPLLAIIFFSELRTVQPVELRDVEHSFFLLFLFIFILKLLGFYFGFKFPICGREFGNLGLKRRYFLELHPVLFVQLVRVSKKDLDYFLELMSMSLAGILYSREILYTWLFVGLVSYCSFLVKQVKNLALHEVLGQLVRSYEVDHVVDAHNLLIIDNYADIRLCSEVLGDTQD